MGAGRMKNGKIPRTTVDGFKYVALVMKFTLVVGRQQVAGPCVMAKLTKRRADDTAILATDQYIHGIKGRLVGLRQYTHGKERLRALAGHGMTNIHPTAKTLPRFKRQPKEN